jgi:hypothetical protein
MRYRDITRHFSSAQPFCCSHVTSYSFESENQNVPLSLVCGVDTKQDHQLCLVPQPDPVHNFSLSFEMNPMVIVIGRMHDPLLFFPAFSSRRLPLTRTIDSSLHLPPLTRDLLLNLRCPAPPTGRQRPRHLPPPSRPPPSPRPPL